MQARAIGLHDIVRACIYLSTDRRLDTEVYPPRPLPLAESCPIKHMTTQHQPSVLNLNFH